MVLTHTGYILPSLPRLVLTLGTYHRPSAGAGQPSPAVACSAQTRTTTATTTTTTTRSNPIDEPPRRTMMAPMTQEAAAKAASRIERVCNKHVLQELIGRLYLPMRRKSAH
eukprot:8263118-Pyramimonas_sp.AAC.1